MRADYVDKDSAYFWSRYSNSGAAIGRWIAIGSVQTSTINQLFGHLECLFGYHPSLLRSIKDTIMMSISDLTDEILASTLWWAIPKRLNEWIHRCQPIFRNHHPLLFLPRSALSSRTHLLQLLSPRIFYWTCLCLWLGDLCAMQQSHCIFIICNLWVASNWSNWVRVRGVKELDLFKCSNTSRVTQLHHYYCRIIL